MDTKKKRGYLEKMSHLATKNISRVPTQQYYNGAYMEETVHDINLKIRQRGKLLQKIKNYI